VKLYTDYSKITTEGFAAPTPGDSINPLPVLCAKSENSLWLLDARAPIPRYMRIRVTPSTSPDASPWGRLDYETWLPYEYARWINPSPFQAPEVAPRELAINIKPVAGPTDGFGIITGVITHLLDPNALEIDDILNVLV
jgi:hypothetical protein